MSVPEPTPLLPRRVLFGNPDRANVRISPDGARLAWLAPVDGVLEVWVAPVGDLAAARPVTQDRSRGIRSYEWTHAPGRLLYLQDTGGDEDWHVHLVDVEAGTTRDLTPFRGVQAQVEALSPSRPGEVVLATNDRDPRYHDLHVVDLETGARTELLRNERFVAFQLDASYRVHFATESLPSGAHRIHRRAEDGSWSVFAEVGFGDELTTAVLFVSADGSKAYFADSRGRDTGAFVEADLASGATRVLAEHPRSDVAGAITDPLTRRPLAVAFQYLRQEWRALDPAVAEDLAAIARACDGEANVTSSTLDGRLWTVAYVVDDGPVRFHLYDRATRTSRLLFTNRAALEGRVLARMHATTLRARDGLELPSYLTLPPWEKGGGARPSRPLPTVLLVHGGPWARDTWTFQPQHQLLANRGYAVLSVNYRGSTGFGKAFVNAGDGEWAGRMHDDLVDAVRWAVDAGIADPARVAIFGGSYGGYAVLVGLTRTPDLFACGVDIVGPSSIVTLIRSVPPYWEPAAALFKRRVGDPDTPEGLAFLLERSPITHVAEIRRPLLIAQGANDPRVKQAESDAIVAAMKDRGIPVAYVLFPDEGHGFARPENSLAFHAVAEQFLARHLGGRAEPLGDDLSRSSAQIVEGREALLPAERK